MRRVIIGCTILVFAMSILLANAGFASDTAYISIEASIGIDTLIKGIPSGVVVNFEVGTDRAWVDTYSRVVRHLFWSPFLVM